MKTVSYTVDLTDPYTAIGGRSVARCGKCARAGRVVVAVLA